MIRAHDNTDQVPEVGVDELQSLQQAGAVVFDVREPWEHEEVRIPGVVPVPLGAVVDSEDRFRRAAQRVGGPVYVVCAVGGRSAQAVEYLRRRGIDAVNVSGGTNAWVAAGKPVEAGSAPG